MPATRRNEWPCSEGGTSGIIEGNQAYFRLDVSARVENNGESVQILNIESCQIKHFTWPPPDNVHIPTSLCRLDVARKRIRG